MEWRIIPEGRALTRLALPVIGTQLAHQGLYVTDVIMAGRLGAQDLAGVAAGSGLSHPLIYSSMGVLLALTPIVAQLFGAGRDREIGDRMGQGLWAAMCLAIPVILIMRNTGPVLAKIGVVPEVIPIAGR